MKILTVLIALFSLNCLCQDSITIKGTIFDDTQETVPYVNVMILNKKIGTSSNEKGDFVLSNGGITLNDSIVFSCIGYKTTKIRAGEINNTPVVLESNPIILSEIVVGAKSKQGKRKEILLNKFNKAKAFVIHSTTPFEEDSILSIYVPHRREEPTIETMYFSNDPSYGNSPKLKEVIIKLKTIKETSRFSLRIFGTKHDYSPAEDLISTPIIIEVTKKNKVVKINLEKHNIYMPERGFFIGVEYLLIPENISVFTYSESKTIELYSPFIFYNATKDTDYNFYILSKGKWSKTNKKAPSPIPKEKEFSCIPAISCVLSVIK